jgi:hypothetical protein
MCPDEASLNNLEKRRNSGADKWLILAVSEREQRRIDQDVDDFVP